MQDYLSLEKAVHTFERKKKEFPILLFLSFYFTTDCSLLVIQNFRDFYSQCKSRHFYLFDVPPRFISTLMDIIWAIFSTGSYRVLVSFPSIAAPAARHCPASFLSFIFSLSLSLSLSLLSIFISGFFFIFSLHVTSRQMYSPG
jgi:hypothetical protein